MMLAQDEIDWFAEIGIFGPDPYDQLHVRILDAFRRTRGASRGSQLVALQWVMNWDLGRQGAAFAEARSAYESRKSGLIVRFRDAGEKSGAMAETRAQADPEVAELYLRYRTAEQLERLARKRLDTIGHQIEVWRSETATARQADSFHARES